MTDITIPPEAVEKAARAIASEVRVVTESDVRAFELTPEEYAALALTALRAWIAAWPGAAIRPPFLPNHIILPMPTENTNAEA